MFIFLAMKDFMFMYIIHNSNKLVLRERSELVDYIMFKGIIPETFRNEKIQAKQKFILSKS